MDCIKIKPDIVDIVCLVTKHLGSRTVFSKVARSSVEIVLVSESCLSVGASGGSSSTTFETPRRLARSDL